MTHAGAWLALAALVFVPFAFDHFELPHQLVLALGVVVLSYSQRAFAVPRALLTSLALMLGAAVVTTFTSVAPNVSTSALLTLLVVASLALFARPVDGFRAVLWTTWPLAAWAFAQSLGHDPFEWSGSAGWCGGARPFSTLGHPTQLGVWMAMLAVLALDDARSRGSVTSYVTAALAATTCVATLSRAGWLALAVGVAAWLLSNGLAKHVLQRRVTWFALAGLVALVFVGPAALLERVTHFFVAPTRVQLWTTALAGFRLHPLTGWGFDAFVFVDQQLRHPDAWKYEWGSTATHAHSLLSNTLATQGLVGIVALLAAVIVTVRAWRRDGIGNAGAAAVVIAWSAASMVAFSNVLVSALGVCALAASFKSAPMPSRLPKWAPLLALVPLTLTGLQFGASMAGARAATRTDFTQAERWYDAAERLEPTSSMWPALRGELNENTGHLEASAQAYARAAARSPNTAVFEANIGRVASKRGDRELTLSSFDRARRLAPLDAHIAVDAAEASIRLGEWSLAEAALINTLASYPSNGVAWWELARVRYAQGRTLETRAALEAALDADWRDWPEGLGLARTAAVELLASTGDLSLARKYAARPERFALPSEICGAPSKLK